MKPALLIVAFVSFLLMTGFTLPVTVKDKVVLKGIVVDASSRQPVAGVYVYTVEGEEEGITNKNGEFKFATWKKLPVTVTAQHQGYRKKSVKVSNASQYIEIAISKK